VSLMLPSDLVFVLNLIGFNWPTADEDKLRESARHWREYASELQTVMTDVNGIVEQVKGENSAESIDALEQHWRDFSEHLRNAHHAAGTVAEVLDDFAIAVEVLKAAVVGQLLLLAGELAATTGAAFLTFGAAEAAAQEEILLTQGIMRGFVREAIQKVERLIADKVAKRVVEHFLSIKNGLKALKASRTALKDFGKKLIRGGGKDLKQAAGGGRVPIGPKGIKESDAVTAQVGPKARAHILDGEARPNGTFSGGHRGGTGFPGKSEFPSTWSDDQIVRNITDVANDPAAERTVQGSLTVVTGSRDGVEIRVVMNNRTGEIVTGYPTNLPMNP